jgi:hypothetical protein
MTDDHTEDVGSIALAREPLGPVIAELPQHGYGLVVMPQKSMGVRHIQPETRRESSQLHRGLCARQAARNRKYPLGLLPTALKFPDL